MVNRANRCLTLLRRQISAARLGFIFMGHTHTPFPASVRLRGGRVPLSVAEKSSLADLINIFLDDEYGLTRLKAQPQRIVDIGANIGLFSLWAAHHFPGAVVHAYEPNPRILPLLKANLSSTSATIFECGVARLSGRAALVDESESRLAKLSSGGGGGSGVPLVGLAGVIETIGGRIDLLKMDCEGGEWDILEDTESLKQVRFIRMEYHLRADRSLPDFIRMAERSSFKIAKLAENRGFGIAWLDNTALK